MPGANVRWPLPMTQWPTLWASQMGVPGTDDNMGARLHSTGQVFYVDPNFPGASDARDGFEPTDPLLTVAAALSKCQPHRGDVIVVGANSGWYYAEGGSGIAGAQYTSYIQEEVEITVAGVRLVGLQNSPLGVMWEPVSNGGTCITVSAVDVVIEGFVFTTGPILTGCDAIYCGWDGVTLFGENLTVRNCYFDDTVDVGISGEFAWYCDVHDNVFMQCDEYAIYVDPAGSGIAFWSIHNNVFHDCAVAMALQGCEDSLIANNDVYSSNAESGAVATNEGINTTGGSSNMIRGNYWSCLMPVPANGDWDDFNTGSATDAFIHNKLLNGIAVTTPT